MSIYTAVEEEGTILLITAPFFFQRWRSTFSTTSMMSIIVLSLFIKCKRRKFVYLNLSRDLTTGSPHNSLNQITKTTGQIMLEAVYNIPFLLLEVPNLKIKQPTWIHMPSAMTMFSLVLFSYFLVTGGMYNALSPVIL